MYMLVLYDGIINSVCAVGYGYAHAWWTGKIIAQKESMEIS